MKSLPLLFIATQAFTAVLQAEPTKVIDDHLGAGTLAMKSYYSIHPNPEGSGWLIDNINGYARNYADTAAWSTLVKSFPSIRLEKPGDSITLSFTFLNGQITNPEGTMDVWLLHAEKTVDGDWIGAAGPLEGATGIGLRQVMGASEAQFFSGRPSKATPLGEAFAAKSNTGIDEMLTYKLTLTRDKNGLNIEATVGDKKMPRLNTDATFDVFDTLSIRAPYAYTPNQRWRDSKLGGISLTSTSSP